MSNPIRGITGFFGSRKCMAILGACIVNAVAGNWGAIVPLAIALVAAIAAEDGAGKIAKAIEKNGAGAATVPGYGASKHQVMGHMDGAALGGHS